MARMKDFTNQIRGPYLVLYPTKRRYKNGSVLWACMYLYERRPYRYLPPFEIEKLPRLILLDPFEISPTVKKDIKYAGETITDVPLKEKERKRMLSNSLSDLNPKGKSIGLCGNGFGFPNHISQHLFLGISEKNQNFLDHNYFVFQGIKKEAERIQYSGSIEYADFFSLLKREYDNGNQISYSDFDACCSYVPRILDSRFEYAINVINGQFDIVLSARGPIYNKLAQQLGLEDNHWRYCWNRHLKKYIWRYSYPKPEEVMIKYFQYKLGKKPIYSHTYHGGENKKSSMMSFIIDCRKNIPLYFC